DGAAGVVLSRFSFAAPVTLHASTSSALTGNVIGAGVTIDGGSSDVVADNRFGTNGTAILLTGGAASAAIESNSIIAGSLASTVDGVSRLFAQSSAAAKGIAVGTLGVSNVLVHRNRISGVGSGIVLGAAASGQ